MTSGFTPISFSLSGGGSLLTTRAVKEMEKILSQFASNWGASLSTLLTSKSIALSLEMVELIPYGQFVSRQGEESADFQIFEIEALESLCVWVCDRRLVTMVVDGMFGGHGRWPHASQLDRPLTPIEAKIRLRLWESLANAYESPWQAVLPQRLRPLREEKKARNLRLVSAQSPVYSAHLTLHLNRRDYRVSFCLPASQQLQTLWSDEAEQAQEAVWGKELRQQIRYAPIEATAIIARRKLTVSEMLQMTVGQVLDIDMDSSVDVQIDGVSVLSGRYGVKNEHYAVKVEQVLDNLERWTGSDHGVQEMPQPQTDAAKHPAMVPEPLQTAAAALKDFDQHLAGAEDAKK
jgi:flagellar motor switch protein FliM